MLEHKRYQTRIFRFLTTATLLAATCLASAGPMVIYVDADTAGANNGTSWADALNHLQDALTAAVSGNEIWVAAGISTSLMKTRPTPWERETATAVFVLINGVGIYGGFAGSETQRNQRNHFLNETVVSGDLDDDDVGMANMQENSLRLIGASAVDNSAVFDGFTITKGNANASTASIDGGAGLLRFIQVPSLLIVCFCSTGQFPMAVQCLLWARPVNPLESLTAPSSET